MSLPPKKIIYEQVSKNVEAVLVVFTPCEISYDDVDGIACLFGNLPTKIKLGKTTSNAIVLKLAF